MDLKVSIFNTTTKLRISEACKKKKKKEKRKKERKKKKKKKETP